jgi:hypothetical protein
MHLVRRWLWLVFVSSFFSTFQFCISQAALAQKSDPQGIRSHAKNARPSSDCSKSAELNKDSRATRLLRNLLKRTGIQPEAVDTLVVDSDTTHNAAASILCNRPIIYFNNKYLNLITQSSKTEWAQYGIAAHEVGHILSSHLLPASKQAITSREIELQADYFSGYTLARLGATLPEALSATTVLKTDIKIQSAYPPTAERRARITKGWLAAKRSLRSGSASAAVSGLGSAAEKFHVRDNSDINGHDARYFPADTFKLCAQACSDEPKCAAVSYDKWSNLCFLKSELAETNIDAKSTVAVKKPNQLPKSVDKAKFPAFINPQNDYGISGIKSQTENTPDSKTCMNLCDKKTDCIAYTFSKRSHNCDMLTGASSDYFDPMKSSGYKIQRIR